MLVNIGPILIAVFAGLLLGEGFPRWLVVGIAVAFAGVLLIGIATRSAADRPARRRPLRGRRGHLRRAAWSRRSRCCGGCPALQVTVDRLRDGRGLLPAVGRHAGRASSGRAPAGSIAGMVYLGAVPTAIAFSTWAYALSRMDAGKLGVTTYLVPPLVDPARLAAARRGAAGAGARRRRGLPGRRGALPPPRRRLRPPVPVPQEASPTV